MRYTYILEIGTPGPDKHACIRQAGGLANPAFCWVLFCFIWLCISDHVLFSTSYHYQRISSFLLTLSLQNAQALAGGICGPCLADL